MEMVKRGLIEIVGILLILLWVPFIAVAFTGIGVILTATYGSLYVEFLDFRRNWIEGRPTHFMDGVVETFHADDPCCCRYEVDDTRNGDLGYRGPYRG